MNRNSAVRLRCSNCAIAALALMLLAAPQLAAAQSFKVLYTFTGGNDGAYPIGTLSMDRGGSLYAAAYSHGGSGAYGTIWRLQPKNSAWIFTPLYTFNDVAQGIYPRGASFGPDGSLYGATENGTAGCGVVFNLKPPPSRPVSALSPWNETVLYQLTGHSDGCTSEAGVAFDQAGNIHGTTTNGGAYGAGVAFQLTRSGSSWTEKIIHNFGGSTMSVIQWAQWSSTMPGVCTATQPSAVPMIGAPSINCRRPAAGGHTPY